MSAHTLTSGSSEMMDVASNHASLLDGLAGSGSVSTAKIATAAVTGTKIAATAVDQLITTAADASGSAQSVTLTGAALGDKVTSVMNMTDLTEASASFEAVISIAGHIAQSATNLSTKKIIVSLIKG